MKTVSVALVVCLNAGCDPPDIVKTQPCARLECWIDPLVMSSTKATEAIGNNLQKQYERWQPRARYKQCLDPTVEDVKKLCTTLRRNAKDDRVLFHYNGHGVPKPTTNGEIWVFNKTFTQYMPLSIYDLQTWMGSPSIYVFDCSNAGVILRLFDQFAEQHEKEYQEAVDSDNVENAPLPQPSFKHCIQLAACSEDQILPMNPDLPADVFTSCLTTPIKIGLRWFVMQNASRLVPSLKLDTIDKIPGNISDRRTMFGELNWIFTAITDTIAWNSLSKVCDMGEMNCQLYGLSSSPLFCSSHFRRKSLFRQDLLVASLFRNFLLAERIMQSYNCTPISNPKMPEMYQHPLWLSWDLCLHSTLAQLPGILGEGRAYVNSTFFEQQLTSFDVWLQNDCDGRNPPEQLPVVLQVLLSNTHRLRALDLLCRFLDFGPWSVNLALSLGIYPYILKLLQSGAAEIRPFLVHIWAKILAIDNSCQTDLVKEGAHKYFLQILQDSNYDVHLTSLLCPRLWNDLFTRLIKTSEHFLLTLSLISTMEISTKLGISNLPLECKYRKMAAFVLASLITDYELGQEAALQGNMISVCLDQLSYGDNHLRQWLIICLARSWQRYNKARWCGVRDSAHEKLYVYLKDDSPEIRASSVFALGTLTNTDMDRTEHTNNIDQSVTTMLINVALYDMSPLVRKELVVAIQWMVMVFENALIPIASREQNDGSSYTMMTDQVANLPSNLRRNVSRDRIRSSYAVMSHSASSALNTSASNLSAAELIIASESSDRESLKRIPSNTSLNCSGATSSLSPTSSVLFGGFYVKLWHALCSLELDPHPEVAEMAHVLTTFIRDQVKENSAGKDQVDRSTCFSLPPSPSTRLYVNANKPELQSNCISPSSDTKCSPQSKKSANSATESETAKIRSPLRSFKLRGKVEISGDIMGNCRALVRTKYVEWCAKEFSNPVTVCKSKDDSVEKLIKDRQWKLCRNSQFLQEAQNECALINECKLELHVFTTRFTHIPSILLFHPYYSYIVAAAKNKFGVWDYNSISKLCTRQENPVERPWNTQITAMDWINEDEDALLVVASNDGAVRVWNRYDVPDKPPHLVTAWNALPELNSITTKSLDGASDLKIGMKVCWNQRSRRMFVGGSLPVIRVWDAAKELKLHDLPTGSDFDPTCLSTTQIDDEMLIAGFEDGSVRVFDQRLPPYSCRTLTYREHTGSIHSVTVREHSSQFIAACTLGEIRYFDLRKKNSALMWRLPTNASALTVHRKANLLACATTSNVLGMYNLSGDYMNAVRTSEWYQPTRSFNIKATAFHPHRVLLSYALTDSTLSVWGSDSKKGGLWASSAFEPSGYVIC